MEINIKQYSPKQHTDNESIYCQISGLLLGIPLYLFFFLNTAYYSDMNLLFMTWKLFQSSLIQLDISQACVCIWWHGQFPRDCYRIWKIKSFVSVSTLGERKQHDRETQSLCRACYVLYCLTIIIQSMNTRSLCVHVDDYLMQTLIKMLK